MIDDMPLYLPGSNGKVKPPSYVIPKNPTQKSTMYWHAHQAVVPGGTMGKSSVVTEAVTLDGLRRSLKTANNLKRSTADDSTLDKLPSPIKTGLSSNQV